MAAEDSRDTANDSDSLLELETSVFVLSHSTAPPKKTKMTRTLLKIRQKRNLVPRAFPRLPEAVEANADETALSCLGNRDWCT